MAWTYRKKLVAVHKTQEEIAIFRHADEFVDWFYDQVAQGLADSARAWLPYRDTGIDGLTIEILVTDQAQADSYIAMGVATCEKLGYTVSYSVEDVDLQRESYEDY